MSNLVLIIAIVCTLGALGKAFSLAFTTYWKNRQEEQNKPPKPPGEKKPLKPGEFRYCPMCRCTLEIVVVEGDEYQGCKPCNYVKWNNPIPVAVAVIPYGKGLIFVRRAIPPIGKLALPGGFLKPREGTAQAAIREAFEETHLEVVVDRFVKEVPLPQINQILFFYLMKPATGQKYIPGSDASECMVMDKEHFDPTEIAFPTHREMIEAYFGKENV